MDNLYYVSWAMVSIVFLSIGAYFDLKERLIPDKVWLGQLLCGSFVSGWWLLSDPGLTLVLVTLINFTLSLIVSVIAFLIGSLSGGDVKALIVLAVSSPLSFTVTSINWNIETDFPPVFYFLLNFLVFLFLFMFYNLGKNILTIPEFGPLFAGTRGTITQQISVLVSSQKTKVTESMDLTHKDPAEKLIDGVWTFHTPLFQDILDDEEFARREKIERDEALRDISLTQRNFIWLRPQPPGIVFFLFAYILLVLFGSPLGWIFDLFLS